MEEYKIFRESFARKLKRLRLSYGMTQEEFSEKMNVSYATYVKVERDKMAPSVLFLKKLIKYTNVPADCFLRDDYNELERIWLSVKCLSEVDQIIILKRLVRKIGKAESRELIDALEELE